VFLVGTQSADHIRASGQSGCIRGPDTWLYPNASLIRQIPLATRAPSIHGPSVGIGRVPQESFCRGLANFTGLTVEQGPKFRARQARNLPRIVEAARGHIALESLSANDSSQRSSAYSNSGP
jgi:hypothetical protein